MASETDRGSTRIHWLVAGRFSPEPRGELFAVSLASLDAALAARAGTARARVPDLLGASAQRDLVLPVRSLRGFTLAGVVEAVPELRALRALAERPPATAEEAAAAVERVVGPGRLSAACAAAMRPEAVAGAPAPAGAAAAVDAFVKAGGPGSPAGPGGSAARRVRDAIEAAVFGSAREVLSSGPIRGLESSWRGLRMLLGECPEGSDMHVELLDAAPEDVAAAIRARPPLEAFDEPDALFASEAVGATEVLAGLADLAEELLVPCVASVEPRLLAAATAADLAARTDREEPPPASWDALRAREATRWLCAAVNPVALFSEGAGPFQRTAFGGPAWAVAAMLAASYRAQGAFAAAIGRAGALAAPAGHTVREGPQAGTRAPTEAFLAIPAQKGLAARGVLALGSVLDSDRIVVSAAPMVASAAGAVPLPAQLLTGRIVRFARWATGQLDPALPPDQVTALFEQAARFFLFPGLAGKVALGAKVAGEGTGRALRVAARVEAAEALVPLSIEFELPLRRV